MAHGPTKQPGIRSSNEFLAQYSKQLTMHILPTATKLEHTRITGAMYKWEQSPKNDLAKFMATIHQTTHSQMVANRIRKGTIYLEEIDLFTITGTHTAGRPTKMDQNMIPHLPLPKAHHTGPEEIHTTLQNTTGPATKETKPVRTIRLGR